MNPATTLDQIRDAAAVLAAAARNVENVAREQEAAIRAAIAPIIESRRQLLDLALKRRIDAEETLQTMLNQAPQLFVKPRSLSIDGVKCGYQKSQDGFEWGDEQLVIDRIKALVPDKVDLLIRTEQSLVVDAIGQLDAALLPRLGITQKKGVDAVFIKIGESEVEKLARAIIAEAAKRREDEAVPKPRRARAKAA